MRRSRSGSGPHRALRQLSLRMRWRDQHMTSTPRTVAHCNPLVGRSLDGLESVEDGRPRPHLQPFAPKLRAIPPPSVRMNRDERPPSSRRTEVTDPRPEEETPGTIIGKLTAVVTGEARDAEGHLLDADGNRVHEEGDQE